MSIDLRTSERATLKRCPQKWYWSFVDGLTPMRPANALWFGAAVHEGMAQWYLPGKERGPHPAETFSASLEGDRSFLVTNEEEEKEYADARELGVDMLEHYVETYDDDPTWDVISTEQTFRIWIPSLDGRTKRFTRYVGTFDGVYRDLLTGEIWLMEHKTAASIQVTHLPLDDQAGSYWAIASRKLRKMGVLGPDEEIAGIMYNFLRKAKRDTRPVNERGLRTNKPLKQHYIEALDDVPDVRQNMKLDELEEIAKREGIIVVGEESKQQPSPHFERHGVYRTRSERKTMIERIQKESFFADAWRRGELPLYKTPVAIGAGACQYQCEFFRLCQLHEQDDEGWEEFRDAMYNTRDPYEAHPRKSTDS